MIENPLFYPAAVVAIILVGISKGGFGGGLAIMAVPIMALTIPPLQAAAIMLPILCIMDITGLHAYWKTWDTRNLRIMIPGGLAGIALAALTFHWVSEDMLRVLVGCIAVSFTMHYYMRARHGHGPPADISVIRGGFWSAVSGFTSFAAHAGGPPATVYLLPQRLDKTLFAGTAVVFFTTVNYAKLVPYAWLGQFSAGNLLTALVLAPLAPVGIRLGIWLHHRVSQVWFYRICYTLLFFAGVRLLWQGASNLL
ncbi:MAG: sulfite exporter TauE/SafE family protein [Aquisalimonadaceae bacterium]